MTWRTFLFAIIVFGPFHILNGAGNEIVSPELRLAMSRLSKDKIMAHTTYLGSDQLEGRGTGRKGGALAATYLAEEMRAMGLQPVGDDRSFFQRIPMQGSFPLASSRLQISRGRKSWQFSLGHDYLLYEMGSQTHIPQPVPLVFAGYGVVAPEYDYNDYQDIDVEGAVVVVLDGEPLSEDPQWFEGVRPTIHSLPKLKQRIAASRGALGCIVIPTSREDNRPWSYWVTTFEFEHVVLPYQVPANLSLLWNPAKAEILFQGARYSFDQVLAMDSGGLTRSFSLQTRISFQGRFREREFTAVNVSGLLPGSDPLLRDSFLIVSAHYDHLGIGPPLKGDTIYNGVVDNALGVGAVMEMARVFKGLTRPPRRSILFLLLTGKKRVYWALFSIATIPWCRSIRPLQTSMWMEWPLWTFSRKWWG